MAVWLDGGIGVAQVGILLRAKEDMGVDVDESRHDVETGRIHDPTSLGRIDVGGYSRNLRAGHRHIRDRVDAICRIDDAAVLDQKIEWGILTVQRSGRHHHGAAVHPKADARESLTYEHLLKLLSIVSRPQGMAPRRRGVLPSACPRKCDPLDSCPR